MKESAQPRCISPNELHDVLESIPADIDEEVRSSRRLPSRLMAELALSPDKIVQATIRDISSTGMGFSHQEPISPGFIAVKAFTEEEPVTLRLVLEWCQQQEDGTYQSGGRYLRLKRLHDDWLV